MMATVVEMRDITMSFGTNEVLKGINLKLEAGKVTAVLGANGAGKSTLIKVLSGVHSSYGGTVIIDGAAV
jgi:ABC-type sugar transport system ATPase subunit